MDIDSKIFCVSAAAAPLSITPAQFKVTPFPLSQCSVASFFFFSDYARIPHPSLFSVPQPPFLSFSLSQAQSQKPRFFGTPPVRAHSVDTVLVKLRYNCPPRLLCDALSSRFSCSLFEISFFISFVFCFRPSLDCSDYLFLFPRWSVVFSIVVFLLPRPCWSGSSFDCFPFFEFSSFSCFVCGFLLLW